MSTTPRLNFLRPALALGILFCATLPSQKLTAQHRDLDELIRLQSVLKAAIDRVAPSTVTIETFGGSRALLTSKTKNSDGSGRDGGRPKLTSKIIDDLFRDMEPKDFKRYFKDVPAEERKELRPDDLRALDTPSILRLIKKYPARPTLIDKQHDEFFAQLTAEEIAELAPTAIEIAAQKAAVRKQLEELLLAKEVHAWLEKHSIYPILSARDWDKLFNLIPSRELEELFPELNKDEVDALTPDDLKKLSARQINALLKAHPLRNTRPKNSRPKNGRPKKKKKKKGLGNIVQPGFLQAQGSTTGIILSSDGWILVSRFALNFNPTTILVTLPDGRSFHAERFGEDTSRGIAVLKIDATDLPVPVFANPDKVRVGQWAFVLGRTFGADRPSVHMGVVSATNRLFKRAIQTDANTSPANYGGPLIDVHGQILGISVPLSPSGRDVGVDWYDSGIGFCSTIADISDLIDRMREGEILHRAWIGIQTAPEHMGPGAKIANVFPDSPAMSIGLRRGDKLLEIDKVAVKNPFHLLMLLSSKMAGDSIHLVYQRRRQDPVGVTVFLDEVPQIERKAQSKKAETFTPPWEEGDPTKKK